MKVVKTRIILIWVSLVVIGLFFAGVSYAAIDPGTIAGLWLFDEGSGDVAADSSGNGNDGAFMGDPTWISGKFGNALEFDGDDYVSVNDSDSLDMTDQITVMFWFRTDKAMADMWADRQVVVGKNYVEYEVGIYMEGQIHTYTSDGAADYDEGVMASMSEELGEAEWELGKWYHVAWTLNGQHEVAYVNGINIGEHDKAHANTLPGDNPLEIGERVGGSLPVTGAVDEVVILNVALEETDIQDAMNRGMGTVLGGLTAVSPADKLATAWGDVKTR
jgi:hypothetical protein